MFGTLAEEMADSVDRPAVHKDALQQAFDLLNITPAELGFDKLRARDDGSRLKPTVRSSTLHGAAICAPVSGRG